MTTIPGRVAGSRDAGPQLGDVLQFALRFLSAEPHVPWSGHLRMFMASAVRYVVASGPLDYGGGAPGPQRRVPGERQSHMLGMRTVGIPGTCGP